MQIKCKLEYNNLVSSSCIEKMCGKCCKNNDCSYHGRRPLLTRIDYPKPERTDWYETFEVHEVYDDRTNDDFEELINIVNTTTLLPEELLKYIFFPFIDFRYYCPYCKYYDFIEDEDYQNFLVCELCDKTVCRNCSEIYRVDNYKFENLCPECFEFRENWDSDDESACNDSSDNDPDN